MASEERNMESGERHTDLEENRVEPAEIHVESEEAHVESEETHVESEETHVESAETHVESEETHVESEETNVESGETHVESEESHVESEETNVESEETNVESEETHVDSEESHVESEENHAESEENHAESEENHTESEENHTESEENHEESEEGKGSFAYTFVDKLGERRPIPGVQFVDLCKQQNGTAHHTFRFHLNRQNNNELVLRRGQPFHLKIKFDVEFDSETDDMQLLLQVGKKPKVSQGTEQLLSVLHKKFDFGGYWGAYLLQKKGQEMTVVINTPADCIPGVWSLEIQTIRKEDVRPNIPDQPIMNRYSCHNLYILFNPWCKDDLVYMSNEEWLTEYVVNDIGKIWRGVASNFRPCVWSFGQYEHNILEACMVLLDWSNLRITHRANPIHVTRTVSAMVNANDDRGILVGNWSGEYEDGTPPTDWQGSVQILQQWYDGGGEPVCYGQCWVFSGVTTTVLRTLGIPARSVTNFASAHDTDASLTIDLHFNEKGKHQKELDSDSVWNFHVWNDCWMQRPDLPKGYGGWQALDATPQEMSAGMFRTGPASHVAVRRGEVGYQYDTGFVFAEVNADKVYWLHKGQDVPLKFIDLDRVAIGKNLSTRRPGPMLPGNQDREDITQYYKQTEMSDEERMAVRNAIFRGGSTSSKSVYQTQEEHDVVCELEVKEEIQLGQEFYVRVKVQNKSKEVRTAKACIRVDTMHYTGILVKRVAKDFSEVYLKPGKEEEVSLRVKPEEYLDKLLDQGSMMMSAMLHIKETGQTYHAEDDFRVRFPDIDVRVQGILRVGKTCKVFASFNNPLDKYLTRAKFIFEAPGIEDPTEIRIPNVGRHQKAEACWEITPEESGDHTILVSFTSNQLRDVDGCAAVNILPARG